MAQVLGEDVPAALIEATFNGMDAGGAAAAAAAPADDAADDAAGDDAVMVLVMMMLPLSAARLRSP